MSQRTIVAALLLVFFVTAAHAEPAASRGVELPGNARAEEDGYNLPVACGDGWCDHGVETSADCPADCFAACYGSEELCARGYDEVAVIFSHNAAVSEAYGFLEVLNQNQNETLTWQLDHGVRSMQLDIDYCRPNGNAFQSHLDICPEGLGVCRPTSLVGADLQASDICLCHGNNLCELSISELLCTWIFGVPCDDVDPETCPPPCLGDASIPIGSLPAADGLGEIRTWLEQNPSEILGLDFESYLVHEDLEWLLEDTGLMTYVYDPPAGDDLWPYSWNNMAKMGQRVVILRDPPSLRATTFSAIHGPGGLIPDPWPECSQPPAVDDQRRKYLGHTRGAICDGFCLGDEQNSICANATVNIAGRWDRCVSYIEANNDTSTLRPWWLNTISVDYADTLDLGPNDIPIVASYVNGLISELPPEVLDPPRGCDCHHDEDCETDEFCFRLLGDPTWGINYCSDALADGWPCPVGRDSWCLSDVCNVAVCVAEGSVASGDPCDDDRACSSGTCSAEGVCE